MDIRLDENLYIPKGNFGFVYDKTNEHEIFDLLLACESVYKVNYEDFAHKLRMAFESIAVWFEMKYLKEHGLAEGKSDTELKKEITKNVISSKTKMCIGNQQNRYYTYKNMLIRWTYDFPEKFEDFLHEFSFDIRRNSRENLSYYIRYIYDFGSRSSHAGESGGNNFIPNRANSSRVLHSFHDFLCVLFSSDHVFSESSIPIRDFFPVPRSVCLIHGLSLSNRETLYVREEHNRVRYYLGVTEKTDVSLKDKREMEAIRRLWEESYDDPVNIIRSADLIQGADEGERYQFYALADFPVSLSQTLLDDLSKEEKIRIIQGICRGIYFMHCCNPPVYHRNLCPEVFLLFKVQNRYKVLLADFQYSKSNVPVCEINENANETVFFDLRKMASCVSNSDYFAPEVRYFTGDRRNLDWEKADVFSLGQLWLYIVMGTVIKKPEDTYRIVNRADISTSEKDILADMLSWDADDRPHMEDVIKVICPSILR